ncbi:PRD domain-containing protein [Corynebacterium sp. HMSC073D01]|uniref:PRD domain-containing protein n=1 Tax=Corynebacterium sp. HMSC073D01 TaxID=1739536 RepID=UPI0008A5BAD9|nr:PRD domain-containing protein [Corynebacterium sp. HMSC073D01]OFO46321.1 transcription antiterminator BglG [Corynebacterium sp. HMSC073D01]
MKILRVFNNNVVLAKSSSGEVIATGRGIGFQAHRGDTVPQEKVQRVFVPTDGRDPDHLAEMLAFIPARHIAVVSEALEEVDPAGQLKDKITLITALADHLGFAIQRAKDHEPMVYPLKSEVENLYPDEYRLAQAVIAAVNRKIEVELPDSESVAIALHLVNAGFASGDLSYTYQMTGVIQQMLEVISSHYGVPLDSSTMSVARFITHLRYLFVRLARGDQLADEKSQLADHIFTLYPDAAGCVEQIVSIIELRFDTELTKEEIAYLTLHVARLGTTERIRHE